MPRRGLYLFIMPIFLLAWFFVFGGVARADIIVKADNNWWGTADGPCPWRQLIPPGVPIWQVDIRALCGDKVLVDSGVVYEPFLTRWPEPEAVEINPVIIVPGIMGSYLYSYI